MAVATMIGVIALDVLEGILHGGRLALLLSARTTAPARPTRSWAVCRDEGIPMTLLTMPDAIVTPGLLLTGWRRDRVLQRLLLQETGSGIGHVANPT